MIAGLAPETALGRVVAIRSETDKDIIKHFTKDQRKIYDNWRWRTVRGMNEKTFKKEMKSLEKMFAAICLSLIHIFGEEYDPETDY